MAWIYLAVAGVLEIVWAYFMKESDGFSRLTPTLITLTAMIGSFWLLASGARYACLAPGNSVHNLDWYRCDWSLHRWYYRFRGINYTTTTDSCRSDCFWFDSDEDIKHMIDEKHWNE